MQIYLTTIAAFLALALGSSANVLIYRLPLDLGLSKPASFCPECKTPIKWYENIPLLSFILQRGKCNHCSSPIGWQYPLVELAVLLLSAPFIYKYIWSNIAYLSSPKALFFVFIQFFAITVIITLLLSMGIIDLRHFRLPHKLTWFAIFWGLAFYLCFDQAFFSSWQEFLRSSVFQAFVGIGVVLFIFDAFTHFMNRIFFKEKALAITPTALTFGSETIARYIETIYLGILFISIYLLMKSDYFSLQVLFGALSCSYVISENIETWADPGAVQVDSSTRLANSEQVQLANVPMSIEQDDSKAVIDPDGQFLTTLGGGDAVMAAFLAVLFGIQKAAGVILNGFYLGLAFALARMLYERLKGNSNLDKSPVTKAEPECNRGMVNSSKPTVLTESSIRPLVSYEDSNKIALGSAFAISAIADMIFTVLAN